MLRLLAPAKLNLYLHVLGRRPDGYHEIETLFQRIDLADELTFEPADTLALSCSDPALSCGEENLVMKAATSLQRAAGVSTGARIHLVKRIPVAAGLGGGSSDAATTLAGLNRLWGLGLPPERLVELAAEVGSDVPFFLAGAAFAIGRGRGERCEPLADVRLTLVQVVAVPDAQLSTGEVYQGAQFDLTAATPSSTMLVRALRNGPALAGLACGLRNDLEPEAIRRCPIIGRIQGHLRDLGCEGVRVSGSGPAVYGLCRDVAHAQVVAAQLRSDVASLRCCEMTQTLHHDPCGVLIPTSI